MTSFYTTKSGFDPRIVHVKSVADKMEPVQGFVPEYFSFLESDSSSRDFRLLNGLSPVSLFRGHILGFLTASHGERLSACRLEGQSTIFITPGAG